MNLEGDPASTRPRRFPTPLPSIAREHAAALHHHRPPMAGSQAPVHAHAHLASGHGRAPLPRASSGPSMLPRQPPPPTKRRRPFVVPPPAVAGNEVAPQPDPSPLRVQPRSGNDNIVHQQEAPPSGILRRELFHATMPSFPHPRSSYHPASTSLSTPRRCQSFPEPVDHGTDTRSSASTPSFGFEGTVDDYDYNYNPRTPIFDWTPTSTTDDTTQGADHEEVLTQLTTPASVASKDKRRKNNYNHDEDMVLCDSWMHISYDGAIGTDQPAKAYWQRITDDYNNRINADNNTKKLNMVARNSSSLEHRWGIIQKECMKFQAIFEKVERRHRIGIPYQEQLIEAQAIFAASAQNGKACAFTHCWLKVRYCEKFISLHEGKKPTRSTTPSEGAEEQGLNSTIVPPAKRDRPPGRKQCKEKLKKHEESEELTVWSSFLQMKTEEKQEREARWKQSTMLEERKIELEEHARQRQLELEERGRQIQEQQLQWEKENKIMFCDVSTMDENQRAYVMAMRAEIARAKVAKVAEIASDGVSGSYAPGDGGEFSSV